jgi:hypothetical protein
MNENLIEIEAARAAGRKAYQENCDAPLLAEDAYYHALRMSPGGEPVSGLMCAWRDGWIRAAREADARRVKPDALVDGRNGLADFISAALTLGTPLSDLARREMLQSLPHLRGIASSRAYGEEFQRVHALLFPKKD